MSHRFVVAAVALIAVSLMTSEARAATITVNTTADTSAVQCTLRDAIAASNANAATGACSAGSGPADVIDLKSLSGTITLASALPAIGAAQSSADIQGPGSSVLTVSGGNSVAVFYVTGTASMSGLTVADGHCTFGCGIRNDDTVTLDDVTVDGNVATVTGGVSAFPEAGGIFNGGTMTLTRSTVENNSAVASGASGQNGPAGGGIFNNGGATLTLDRSAVSGNSATASAPAGGTTNINGGGIDNLGTLNVIRSTISDNAAQASGSTTFNSATGGGIANSNSAAVHVVVDRSTISDNAVTATGPGASNNPQAGGLNVPGSVGSFAVTSSTISGNAALLGANAVLAPVATLRSTIVSSPQGGGQNCLGAATSQGFNLTDGTGCGFDQPTDRLSTNPLLDPGGLADNGGPTPTIALTPASPAIDAGHSSAGEVVDQRGGLRPYDLPGVANAAGGDATDIGAFEVEDTTPPETTITSGPAGGTTISDPSPAFAFASDDAAATFECRFDGHPFSPCSSPTSPMSPLTDGAHSFAVRAKDAAANVDASPAVRSFAVDTTPPETTITSGPTGGTTISDPSPAFAFASDDAAATFECRFDGHPFGACSNPASPASPLTDGAHSFAVRAKDAAANVDASPAVRSFAVDTTPADTTAPETKLTSVPRKKIRTKHRFKKVSIAFVSEPGATFECALDGAAFSPCTSPKSYVLKRGAHVIAVRATDAAANTDPTPATATVKIKRKRRHSHHRSPH